MSASWLPRWRLGHARVASVLTLVAAAVAAILPIPLRAQLVGLAVLVGVTALPHGAVDHLAGRRLLAPRFPRSWPLPFAAGYLGVGALLVLLWILVPPVALGGFLLLSAIHFGLEDAETRAPVPVLLRGLLPVAGPVLFHPGQTATLFAWLLPATGADAVHAVTRATTWLAPFAVLGWGVLALFHMERGTRESRHAATALEILSLLALFVAAPPLVAFGVYFCGWHSVRHGLEQAARLDPGNAARGLRRYALHSLPLTVATIAVALVALPLVERNAPEPVALARVLFVGLAALTLPHVALQEWERVRWSG